jgi:hypothetical protein
MGIIKYKILEKFGIMVRNCLQNSKAWHNTHKPTCHERDHLFHLHPSFYSNRKDIIIKIFITQKNAYFIQGF